MVLPYGECRPCDTWVRSQGECAEQLAFDADSESVVEDAGRRVVHAPVAITFPSSLCTITMSVWWVCRKGQSGVNVEWSGCGA